MIIGNGEDFLEGYVNGSLVAHVTNTLEQISAFIQKCANEKEVLITDLLDNPEIEASYGRIIYCRNQSFLPKLISILAPIQMSMVEAPTFIPYTTEVKYTVSNVRHKTGAGHVLVIMYFEDGYPDIWSKDSVYFESEEALQEAYPDSISYQESLDIARKKKWITL